MNQFDSHDSPLRWLDTTATDTQASLLKAESECYHWPKLCDDKDYLEKHQCIHHLFEAQVERTPEAIALVHEKRQLTYRELNQKANKLAHYLQTLGVQPEVLVGLCLEHSVERVVGLLAVLKAGGAYVPLDPAYPAERLALMLQDSQVGVLLTQDRLRIHLPKHSTRIACLDADRELIAWQRETNLPSGVKPENLAYVIYTSGSTGQPKGVAIEHKALVDHSIAFKAHFGLQGEDRVLQFTSINFDVAAEEIFPSLLGGATIVLRPEPLSDLFHFLRFLEENKLTVINLPTSYWHLWVSELRHKPALIPPSLRLVVVGGEKASPALLTIWQKQVGNRVRWANAYGPTEATITATIYEPTFPCKNFEGSSVPIGRPIANTQAYVLDQHLCPVPAGMAGELCIGGVRLARGYLNHPDLTAEKFLPDPFSNEPTARLYKTGDQVRWLPDGNLEFLGRLDHQVKIRGFRVEPGEIEAFLAQHPGVREAVVVVRETVPGNRRLIAYLVAEQHPAPSFRELRSYLQGLLPDQMIPSAFIPLATFPLTPSLKIDRNTLSDLDEIEYEERKDYVAPRTPIEELVSAIWSEVLGKSQLSIYDTFFELGGDSLSAAQIISRIRETFQLELSLRLLFDTATVAGLAKWISDGMQIDSGLCPPTILPISREEPPPLSITQQRLWLLEQLAPGIATHTIPLTFQLKGQLNTTALEQSLNEVVRRHEALRTSFALADGHPIQVIAAHLQLEIKRIDLRELPDEERKVEVRRLAIQDAAYPFDLNHGPLIRACLLQQEEQEHLLLLNMHHLISDGWSVGILLHELAALYRAYCQGKPSPLPELSIQYADFASWQRQWLQTGILESQLTYWKQQLKGAPDQICLPGDHTRPAVQTFRGSSVFFTLSQSLTYTLRTLSNQRNVTLFMTLLTAFQTLLFRYTGQEDIVVGTPIAGRTHRQTEELIGFFVNTLVLRTDFSGNPGFQDLLEQVREMALGAYAHQDVPFERLVEELQPKRDLSYNPLFQVLFALQTVSMETLNLLDLKVRPLPREKSTSQFDLTLELTETMEGLHGCFEYNTDLFDVATITRMVGHFQTLLENIGRNADQQIGKLPILTEAERYQLLVEWNTTQAHYPKERCIHHLFEERVEQRPDAIALVFEEQQLTYHELNARANQLAHHLQAAGVGPEVLVGLFLERSLDMIIGLLAVFKAGGAYMPLDPAYPIERLAFMLQDSQVTILLTKDRLYSKLEGYQSQLIRLDSEQEYIIQLSKENVSSKVKAENLAYVIYTSGSTGQPKGVAIEHKGLCNIARVQSMTFHVRPESRILQFFSLSFDASIFEIIMALTTGATLYLGTPDTLQPGPPLSRLLREQAITIATLTPSVLKLLSSEELPGLRTIISAGEKCSTEIVAQWARNRQFFNAYGPTETTIWASIFECNTENSGSIIGRPIANTQLYVLDQDFQPVPIGVPGELFIGGDGLARGYLNRPELTTEKFLPNPFSSNPQARLYRTGDQVRYLSDGNLEFLGRLDNQVKIRGFRVELGEIENVLKLHPSVQECLIHILEDSKDDKILVAYIIPRLPLSLEEIRLHMKKRLPAYMIPSTFVMIEAFPLTPNGKIDYRALPVPEQSRSRLDTAFIEPRVRIELQLAHIWEEVLNIRPIGIKDNFFELGGHSLQAAQIMAQIQSLFDRSLPLTTLFQEGTIEQQARLLLGQIEVEPWSPLVKVQPLGKRIPFFAVPPVGGGSIYYVNLSRCMGKDQPFYAFQSRGLENNEEPMNRVEEMAAYYIEAMRSIQPEGPYLLGGWSMGGSVAFEMAQQLYVQGQKVALLALLDTINEYQKPSARLDDAAILQERFGDLLSLSEEHLRSLGKEEQLDYITEKAKNHKGFPHFHLSNARQALKVQKSNSEALLNYVPRVYPDRITLFRGNKTYEEYPERPALGWEGLALEDIEIIEIPGAHLTVLRSPNVEVLAERLKARIIEALEND